jgi:hypothetical protein
VIDRQVAYDIWMLEGFDQMPRKTLDRLLRSFDSTPAQGLGN